MVKKLAVVNAQRCAACGACTKVCPLKAIHIYRGCYAYVESLICVGCGKCARVCPTSCIRVEAREARL